MGDVAPLPSGLFTFPAQPAGEPSRRNWFKELLDHPDCQGDPIKIQEAYESFRQTSLSRSIETAKASPDIAVSPDSALIRYLELQNSARRAAEQDGGTYTPHQEIAEFSASDMNCFCIWARPDQQTLALIEDIQTSLKTLVGDALHLIPAEDMHLSVVEIAHRHTVPFLREVSSFIGDEMLGTLLSVPSTRQPPVLIKPMLLFDKSGVALSFVPAVAENTYHHLRTQLHTMLLVMGMAIDTCYTAPIAHITIARFVEDTLFSSYVDSPKTREEQVHAWVDLISAVNRDLRRKYWGEGGEAGLQWAVGKELGLEAQLGYIKFGRPRRMALMVGSSSQKEG